MRKIFNFKKRKVSIPPKKNGFRGINIICSNCGRMYSEASGHTCGEDDFNEKACRF